MQDKLRVVTCCDHPAAIELCMLHAALCFSLSLYFRPKFYLRRSAVELLCNMPYTGNQNSTSATSSNITKSAIIESIRQMYGLLFNTSTTVEVMECVLKPEIKVFTLRLRRDSFYTL